LEVSAICRHKLTYSSINVQQEQTQSRGWEDKKQTRTKIRNQSILERGILIEPMLYLAFADYRDAQKAAEQHICLCRNEDVLLPDSEILEMEEDEFNWLDGFELRFGENEKSFLVGFNRFNETKPMYGWLEITGKPVYGL
jgi:hypothetical protein